MNFSKRKILVGITGSISAYRVLDLLNQLRKDGADLQTILTKGGSRFCTETSVRSLSGHPVHTDLWREYNGVLHTDLADWAELILVAPASANFIARTAAGLADDLLSSVILAANVPICVVPAMNDNMFNNPATQTNIKTLKKYGMQVLEPATGDLVCGRNEIGHILSNDQILKTIDEMISGK